VARARRIWDVWRLIFVARRCDEFAADHDELGATTAPADHPFAEPSAGASPGDDA
jgi:hypothetical protein